MDIIIIRYHYIRKLVQQQHLSVIYRPTFFTIADILTKTLDAKLFLTQLLKVREFPVQINEGKIMGQLQINGNCCSLGLRYLGCIGGKFLNNQSVSTDHSNLLSYIKECREINRCKSKKELKQFVANIFDSSLVGMSKK